MLTVSEAAELLRSFDRVLILTHIRPDGDTVAAPPGSLRALRPWADSVPLPNPA